MCGQKVPATPPPTHVPNTRLLNQGIVMTANHLFQSFLTDQHHKSVLARVGEGVPTPITVFGVLICGGAKGSKVFMHEAVPREVGIVNDFDIAIFKIRKLEAFPAGVPTLDVADYADLHWNQVGSVTSSFTEGTMSAILPAQGIAREYLSGFQLNLLSAPGNSGGPIFCPVTGKVFGVLQGGPVDPKGNPILGLTTAEPVYPAFDEGVIEKLLAHAAQASSER
jgi:hypothetical protein